ncbi:hypothetical protein QLX08_004334 [Tetragonisca angustula]|uniref:Uncharacterized protein n=1 Tax=Tetragonisca angustula TaxID=166442 RepID=A0AAW1A5E6_9HYME
MSEPSSYPCNDQILHSLPNTLNTVKQTSQQIQHARRPREICLLEQKLADPVANGVCLIHDWCQAIKGSSKSWLATEVGTVVTTRKKYQPLVSIQFHVRQMLQNSQCTLEEGLSIARCWLRPSPPLQPRKQPAPRIGGGEGTETGRN